MQGEAAAVMGLCEYRADIKDLAIGSGVASRTNSFIDTFMPLASAIVRIAR